jgi:hypothetical protein
MDNLILIKTLYELYKEIPEFRVWLKNDGGFDEEITYPAFFGFSYYLGYLVDKKEEKILKRVLDFLERMAQSKDMEVIYLFNDFIDSLDNYNEVALEYLRNTLKKKARYLIELMDTLPKIMEAGEYDRLSQDVPSKYQ